MTRAPQQFPFCKRDGPTTAVNPDSRRTPQAHNPGPESMKVTAGQLHLGFTAWSKLHAAVGFLVCNIGLQYLANFMQGSLILVFFRVLVFTSLNLVRYLSQFIRCVSNRMVIKTEAPSWRPARHRLASSTITVSTSPSSYEAPYRPEQIETKSRSKPARSIGLF